MSDNGCLSSDRENREGIDVCQNEDMRLVSEHDYKLIIALSGSAICEASHIPSGKSDVSQKKMHNRQYLLICGHNRCHHLRLTLFQIKIQIGQLLISEVLQQAHWHQ